MGRTQVRLTEDQVVGLRAKASAEGVSVAEERRGVTCVSSRVVGIMGSPREGGNTDRMVSWVLEAAKEAGAEVGKVDLKDLTIAQCRACDTCGKPPYRCVNQDDMEMLQALLSGAQGIVLGTPVYWWGPSGYMKVFVDRWYGFRGDRKNTLRGKKIGLVTPLGDDDLATARHVVGMFQDALDYLKCDLYSPVLAPGCSGRGDVEKTPGLKEKCAELGKWLADR
jgi:multimeric flavodoxin WrbA